MAITRSDGWKIFGVIFIVWLPAIIGLCLAKLPGDLEMHIKIIYAILYTLAVAVFIYFILSKTEHKNKTETKKYGKKK